MHIKCLIKCVNGFVLSVLIVTAVDGGRRALQFLGLDDEEKSYVGFDDDVHEDCADDDDAKIRISQLRKSLLEKLKMHGSFVKEELYRARNYRPACDIKDPKHNIERTVPEGGGGPGYSIM
ncbi:hypothetical protein LOK49_LG02G03792 [Camellia lanceoleosa]|uniref:Uncharacterized protein n=1 Tax=Camellia lanceoleosa TaxID=1840588 RepID=A0ACC0IR36_9ERIC|nr:hypothetical protein LOK49_LG02G03792 [Camellia lanceoleosa]